MPNPAGMAAQSPPAASAEPGVPLRLDDYLPYLINRAGVAMAARFSAVLRHEGISLPDWRVLAALRERNGQRLTELACRTSIEISTLSRLVSSLEAGGLVTRDRDTEDARAIAIRISPAGEDLSARLTPVAQNLEKTALAGLSETEAQQLKELLHRVFDNLDAVPAVDAETVTGAR